MYDKLLSLCFPFAPALPKSGPDCLLLLFVPAAVPQRWGGEWTARVARGGAGGEKGGSTLL